MSVATKLAIFGRKKKVDLLVIQDKLIEELEDLRIRRIRITKKISEQQELCSKQTDMFDDQLAKDEVEKINKLKEERNDIREQIKDIHESLESIAQILERREKMETSKKQRFYCAVGTIGTLAGIGLGYGSDTFATLINKKTLDAAKTALVRLVPRF